MYGVFCEHVLKLGSRRDPGVRVFCEDVLQHILTSSLMYVRLASFPGSFLPVNSMVLE